MVVPMTTSFHALIMPRITLSQWVVISMETSLLILTTPLDCMQLITIKTLITLLLLVETSKAWPHPIISLIFLLEIIDNLQVKLARMEIQVTTLPFCCNNRTITSCFQTFNPNLDKLLACMTGVTEG